MATTIASGTNPYKLGSPPDFGTLYSGRALDFDGVVDYVENTSFTGHQSSVGTISCWAKMTTIAGSGYHFIMGVGGNSTAYKERNIIIDIAGGPYLGVTCHSSNPRTSLVLTTGRWYHFVMTWNGGTSIIYADGVYEAYTTSQTDLLTPEGTNVRLGTASYTLGLYFDGEISNAQVWDKEWSLSDVQYAYTHPEKLITHNSAVTSGTTISNLKAWYPCTEGNPRSPQTTVYDGSPKELSAEKLTNGDFETSDDGDLPTGWAIVNSATVETTTDEKYAGDKSCYVKLHNTLGSGLKQVFTSTDGVPHKVELYVKGVVSKTLQTYSGGAYVDIVANATYSDWTKITKYIPIVSGDNLLSLEARGTGTIDDTAEFYLDDVTVKEVKMGNHGTTTFLGEEMITDGDFTGDGSDWTTTSAQWTYSTANDNAEYSISGSQADGLRQADGDMVSSITVGRKYQIKFTISVATATMTIYNRSQNVEWKANATYAVGTHTVTFTAPAVSGAGVSFYGKDDGNAFKIDDVSVKEVGVATGWTTADAEPLIPQTALMGMSKPIVMDGIDDYVAMGDVLDLGTGNFTISVWINTADIGGLDVGKIISKYEDASNRWYFDCYDDSGADKPRFYAVVGGATKLQAAATNGIESLANTWIHLVLVADRGTSLYIYVNGSSVSLTTNTHDNDDDLGNAGNLEISKYASQYAKVKTNEVSIWSTALSLAEVQELFNDGVPLDATVHSKAIPTGSGTDYLEGYWRNDGVGTWTDRSQNSNNGTPAGSPDTILLPEGTTSGKDILGFPLTHTNNGWLNLTKNADNDGDYVVIKDTPLLDLKASCTIELWQRRHTEEGSTAHVIISKSSSADGWALWVDATNINFDRDDSGGTFDDNSISLGTYDAMNWYHLAITANNDTLVLTYYKDGSSIGTDSFAAAGDGTANTRDIVIGCLSTLNNDWFFDGDIDELKIYNRALSAAEISKNWKHGKSKHSN